MILTDQIVYSVWLNMKEALFARSASALMEYFGDAKNIYDATPEDYKQSGIIKHKSELYSLMNKNLTASVAEVELARRNNVELIDCNSPYYPNRLKEITGYPVLFYARGNIDLLREKAMITIVGSRKATDYGIVTAQKISRDLALSGITVVSGTALGIDSAAHEGALMARGKSIAVAACGLDYNYPLQNHKLRQQIMDKNLMITEYPFRTVPYGKNFPVRNRILSGMSLGVAVIEALQDKSGALITAKHAAEHGRDVFAVPGNVNRILSTGTNALIRDGAILLSGAEDIISEYLKRYPELFVKSEEIQEFYERRKPQPPPESVCSPESCVEYLAKNPSSENEKMILNLLKSQKLQINEICDKSGLDSPKVSQLITILQIKGKIEELPGKYYKKKGLY